MFECSYGGAGDRVINVGEWRIRCDLGNGVVSRWIRLIPRPDWRAMDFHRCNGWALADLFHCFDSSFTLFSVLLLAARPPSHQLSSTWRCVQFQRVVNYSRFSNSRNGVRRHSALLLMLLFSLMVAVPMLSNAWQFPQENSTEFRDKQ